MSIGAVLFDLDGTLVDTAPDLVAVLNQLLRETQRAPMPYAIARNEVSNGALGLLRLGFGLEREAPELPELRQRFLDAYMNHVCIKSRLFIEIKYLIRNMDELGTRWGIVTNKPQAMTDKLLAELGIAAHPGCVIGGDRLPERKPHPAPLQLAAAELGVAPEHCVYIGDAERDIAAGRAAGMATVAALYGYIRPADEPNQWGADALLRHPRELAAQLGSLARA